MSSEGCCGSFICLDEKHDDSRILLYLLWSVVLWDQPVELRSSRKLHALKLLEQTHGHRLGRVGLEEGRRAENQVEVNRDPFKFS